MRNILYLECYSGISGDMAVGALLDLGADQEVLLRALQSLPLTGWQLEISRVKKSGIDACDFHVILDQENHDHDMEYLYGRHQEEQDHCGHGHIQEEGPIQEHEHQRVHKHSHHLEHNHVHRGMKEIKEIICQGNLSERAKNLALRIFDILAEAESKAHHVPKDEVHFHEVGAVDSIIDITAAAVCMDNLDIQEVIVPELWEGRGTVRCQHGILPVPVPAVANIVQAHQLNIRIMEAEGEFVTPTGAAIVAAVKTKDQLPEHFTIQNIGLGAGKRKHFQSGILRAMLIR